MSAPLPMRYILEIYEPMDHKTVLAHFESSSPFGAICKGDIIDPRNSGTANPSQVLRVLSVEHMLWTHGKDIAHKVCICTDAVEPSDELYFGSQE